jgi:dynein heavy chain
MLKSLQVAKGDVLMVMTTVCILMKVTPKSAMNPETQKREHDWWGPCKTMMNGSGFRNELVNYPKEEISDEMIKKLTPYIEQPSYNPERLKVVGTTIASFGDWCMAMYKFFFVNKIVIPKKAALAQAQAEYDVVAAELKIK